MTFHPDDDAERSFTGQVVLGRYHVVLPLGKGGQGMVHLARAEGAAGVARPVVIKRVLAPLANDQVARNRFIAEARITARLRHPDIVSIVEFERESDDTYLMVLEYVHGYDLWRWIRFAQSVRRTVPAHLLGYVCTRVLDALAYSHSLRDPDGTPTPIIHRDVSPGNVLIDVSGHIKLTDFGVAAAVTTDAAGALREGLLGKIGYIAPELFTGEQASATTDIYACGVMLHALLSGRHELHARDVRSAAELALRHVPSRLDGVRTDVTPAGADVIARALEKDPAARYQTAAAFSADLRRAFELDLAEVREEFAAAIARDFEDPSFAERAKVRPLRQIDAAWRRQEDEVISDPVDVGRPKVASLFPTIRDATHVDASRSVPPLTRRVGSRRRALERASMTPEARRRRRRETWGWSIAVAVLVASLATMIGLRGRSLEVGRILYVEAQPGAPPAPIVAEPDALTAAARAPNSAQPVEPLAVPAPPETDPFARHGADASPVAHSRRLTEKFALRRAEVSRCFRVHAGAHAEAKLSVVFEIDPRGQVQRAELSPEKLSETELGACLLKVARRAAFGPQPGYMRFRIPISAQTYGAR